MGNFQPRTPPATRIRVLLVDDSDAFARAALIFLATLTCIESVARAASGREALDAIAQDCPDLVLMDIDMPGMSGIEAATLVKALAAPPQVVLMTVAPSEETRRRARLAGADAFIPKPDLAACLPAMLQALCSQARA